MRDPGERRGHRLGGGAHQRAMEGRADRQEQGPLGALAPGDLDRALDGGAVARDDDLGRVVVVRRLADLPARGLGGHRLGRGEVEPEESRHRPLADRNRLLHRLPAQAEEPRGIAETERTGRAECRIFAERMAGDEGGGSDRHALGLERAHRGERGRHQRRLGVAGQGELGGVTVPDQRRELLAEGRIDLVENRLRRREGRGEVAPHADDLGTLPRKYECARHDPSLFCPAAGPGRS